MAQTCNKFGFFNGIYGLEQSNWAYYWKNVIPDGVLVGVRNEMEVVNHGTDKAKIVVSTGEAFVDNHRAWITTAMTFTLPNKPTANDRWDAVVLRAVYGNSGESRIEVDIIVGAEAVNPSYPTLTKVTGSKYEIPLAYIYRRKTSLGIEISDIQDARYLFHIPGDDAVTEGFTGNSVTLKNDKEFRNNTPVSSLTVYLPKNPLPTFISGFNFTTTDGFTGVTWRRGAPVKHDAIWNYENVDMSKNLVNVLGDVMTMKNKRYNVIVWWDGNQFMAASKASKIKSN